MRRVFLSDRRAGLSRTLLIVGVGLVLLCAALGLGAALALTSRPAAAKSPAAAEQAASGAAEYDYVPFGSVVANLSDGRLTRYLQVSIILKVEKGSSEALKTALDGGEKAVFQNWLITYLSDKGLDQVGGAAAITRLQREIEDGFNAILAQNSEPKVQAVLFEEFNIQ
jgi:flagellar basal body-associated protein FliL